MWRYRRADPHGFRNVGRGRLRARDGLFRVFARSKIDNEEIYYGFGYNGVGVSAAPWTGKQLSKLVLSNSKELDISKIYKGLPKKFIFPQLRTFYFRLAVWFYAIKDRFNIN